MIVWSDSKELRWRGPPYTLNSETWFIPNITCHKPAIREVDINLVLLSGINEEVDLSCCAVSLQLTHLQWRLPCRNVSTIRRPSNIFKIVCIWIKSFHHGPVFTVIDANAVFTIFPFCDCKVLAIGSKTVSYWYKKKKSRRRKEWLKSRKEGRKGGRIEKIYPCRRILGIACSQQSCWPDPKQLPEARWFINFFKRISRLTQ